MKKYQQISENKNLKIELYYNKGGVNYFTGKTEERGYYLSVSPVEIERRSNGIIIESFLAFSGIKKLILPVKKQSEKQYNIALKLIEFSETELKNYVLNRINN